MANEEGEFYKAESVPSEWREGSAIAKMSKGDFFKNYACLLVFFRRLALQKSGKSFPE